MSKKKRQKHPAEEFRLVRVEWIDACSPKELGWMGRQMAMKFAQKGCLPVSVVGHLIHEGKGHVALAGQIADSRDGGTFDLFMKIPRGCIIKITDLKPVR